MFLRDQWYLENKLQFVSRRVHHRNVKKSTIYRWPFDSNRTTFPWKWWRHLLIHIFLCFFFLGSFLRDDARPRRLVEYMPLCIDQNMQMIWRLWHRSSNCFPVQQHVYHCWCWRQTDPRCVVQSLAKRLCTASSLSFRTCRAGPWSSRCIQGLGRSVDRMLRGLLTGKGWCFSQSR